MQPHSLVPGALSTFCPSRADGWRRSPRSVLSPPAAAHLRASRFPSGRGWRPMSSQPGGRRLHIVAARSTDVFKSRDGIRMARFFEVELEVREYELDQFGVVNHAVYASYCQHGRCEFLKVIGLSSDAVARTGDSLATTELSLKFIAPLRSGDRFVVKVRVWGSSSVRVKFEHFIFKLPNQEPILEATATGVWLGKNYRPLRIPTELFSRIMLFDGYEENGSMMMRIGEEA